MFYLVKCVGMRISTMCVEALFRLNWLKLIPNEANDWRKDKNGVIFKKGFKRRRELTDGRTAPHTSKKPKKVTAVIQVPRSKIDGPNRFTHDEIDMKIIMDKQLVGISGAKLKRSYFKPKEDLVLLHVKVASSVLMEGVLGVQYPLCNKLTSRIPWGNMVISEVILRDFLRRECPEAYDKTSKACLKRLGKNIF